MYLPSAPCSRRQTTLRSVRSQTLDVQARFGSLTVSPVLSGGFSESNSVRVSIDAPFPEDKAPFTDEYDYDSDSDLDDDEVADGDIDIIKMPSRG